MPPRIRLFFAAMGTVLLLLAAFPLYSEFTRRKDIWWTPHAMMVPVLEGGERVEIYVRGRHLVSLLDAGQLLLVDSAGTGAVRASEVGLRFNNWDRVRAERTPALVAYAAGAGAMALLLVLLITDRLPYREERAPEGM